jgi:hypothetical protein
VVARPSTLRQKLGRFISRGAPEHSIRLLAKNWSTNWKWRRSAEQVTQLRDKFAKALRHDMSQLHAKYSRTVGRHPADNSACGHLRVPGAADVYSRSYDNDRSEESSAFAKGDVRRRSNRVAIAETVVFLTAARDYKAPALLAMLEPSCCKRLVR